MKISYRKANLKDIPTIIEITQKTWFPTYEPIVDKQQVQYMFDLIYSPEALEEQMQNGQFFLVQHLDNEPVAFASFSIKDGENSIYKLNKLYLLPEKQGLKLGQKLLAVIEKRTKKIGGKYLDLNVNRYNKAKFFYERCGFEVILEEDVPIGPYFMNDYVMRKPLI